MPLAQMLRSGIDSGVGYRTLFPRIRRGKLLVRSSIAMCYTGHFLSRHECPGLSAGSHAAEARALLGERLEFFGALRIVVERENTVGTPLTDGKSVNTLNDATTLNESLSQSIGWTCEF
jgi:hypothetical protein